MRTALHLLLFFGLFVPCVGVSYVFPQMKQQAELKGTPKEKRSFILGNYSKYIDDYNRDFLKLNNLNIKFNVLGAAEKADIIRNAEKLPEAWWSQSSQSIYTIGHNLLNERATNNIEQPDKKYFLSLQSKIIETENLLAGQDLDKATVDLSILEQANKRLTTNEAATKRNQWILIVAIIAFILYARFSNKKNES